MNGHENFQKELGHRHDNKITILCAQLRFFEFLHQLINSDVRSVQPIGERARENVLIISVYHNLPSDSVIPMWKCRKGGVKGHENFPKNMTPT